MTEPLTAQQMTKMRATLIQGIDDGLSVAEASAKANALFSGAPASVASPAKALGDMTVDDVNSTKKGELLAAIADAGLELPEGMTLVPEIRGFVIDWITREE